MKRRSFLKQTGVTVASLALSTRKMLGAEGQSKAQKERKDNTSLIPKFTFATTLEEQEAQLKTNPLMLRFARSRKGQAGDRYRPVYHYICPEGAIGDPNGLSFWQGRWHMFYQVWPPGDHRQHWGHAVSTDLIHWRDLPYAIYPGPERACFSGSAFVEEDRVVAMYLGHQFGEMVATSSDPLLLNWEKLTDGAVIPEKLPGGKVRQVFDPGIWKKDGMYYAVTQRFWADMKGQLYRSKDLVHWEALHPFVENDTYSIPGDDLSCPYVWPIGYRHILTFFSHPRGGRYFLGDYDKKRDKFVVTAGGDFNFGAVAPSGVHAPSSFPDGKGGVIMILNTNHGIGSYLGGGQFMTLPRSLTLRTHNELGIEPAGDIESLRCDHQQVGSTKLPANQEVVLKNINGNAMEIIAEIDSKDIMTVNGMLPSIVEMNVLRSPNKEEYTRITFFRGRGRFGAFGRKGGESLISIDSTYSSTLPNNLSRAPETAPISMGPNESLKLRVFIDRTIVEVFVNGKQCLAVRVYPGREDSVGVSLRSQAHDTMLQRLDAWQMRSIYE